MVVFTLHFKVDAKLTTVNEITRNLPRVTANKCQKEKIMTLTEVIQKDGRSHLYVKSAITSGQPNNIIFLKGIYLKLRMFKKLYSFQRKVELKQKIIIGFYD